jgi:hypothetical protein
MVSRSTEHEHLRTPPKNAGVAMRKWGYHDFTSRKSYASTPIYKIQYIFTYYVTVTYVRICHDMYVYGSRKKNSDNVDIASDIMN